MGDGEGGRRALSLFASIFPLFPQKRLILRLRTPVHVSLRNAINLPGTGNIFFVCAKWETDYWCFEVWRGGGEGE